MGLNHAICKTRFQVTQFHTTVQLLMTQFCSVLPSLFKTNTSSCNRRGEEKLCGLKVHHISSTIKYHLYVPSITNYKDHLTSKHLTPAIFTLIHIMLKRNGSKLPHIPFHSKYLAFTQKHLSTVMELSLYGQTLVVVSSYTCMGVMGNQLRNTLKKDLYKLLVLAIITLRFRSCTTIQFQSRQ